MQVKRGQVKASAIAFEPLSLDQNLMNLNSNMATHRKINITNSQKQLIEGNR
jgi:hypothetical protein